MSSQSHIPIQSIRASGARGEASEIGQPGSFTTYSDGSAVVLGNGVITPAFAAAHYIQYVAKREASMQRFAGPPEEAQAGTGAKNILKQLAKDDAKQAAKEATKEAAKEGAKQAAALVARNASYLAAGAFLRNNNNTHLGADITPDTALPNGVAFEMDEMTLKSVLKPFVDNLDALRGAVASMNFGGGAGEADSGIGKTIGTGVPKAGRTLPPF